MFCGEDETIAHLFYECKHAKSIWSEVIDEWKSRVCLVDAVPSVPGALLPSMLKFWSLAVHPSKAIIYSKQWAILQGVVTYHIWRARCTALYKKLAPPEPLSQLAPIWKHFDWTLEAHASSLQDLESWWNYRLLFCPPKAARRIHLNIMNIKKEIAIQHDFCHASADKTHLVIFRASGPVGS